MTYLSFSKVKVRHLCGGRSRAMLESYRAKSLRDRKAKYLNTSAWRVKLLLVHQSGQDGKDYLWPEHWYDWANVAYSSHALEDHDLARHRMQKLNAQQPISRLIAFVLLAVHQAQGSPANLWWVKASAINREPLNSQVEGCIWSGSSKPVWMDLS